ncbi:MAG: BatA domain-containing protein, partial [Thermoleophilia bacterium]|nr:BatA domain-containing protein [Thermoleophilia bacterium]
MSFAYPWLLLLLVPLAMGVVWWVWRDHRGVTNRAAIPFADLDLVEMATPRRRSTRWLPGMLLVLAVVGSTVALARPQTMTSVPRDEGSIML